LYRIADTTSINRDSSNAHRRGAGDRYKVTDSQSPTIQTC